MLFTRFYGILELPKGELILVLDLFGKCVPDGLGPAMVVEIDPHFGCLQFRLFDVRHPKLQLLFLVEIIVSIEPVVCLFLAFVPYIAIVAMKTHIGMIGSLLCACIKPRAIYRTPGGAGSSSMSS